MWCILLFCFPGQLEIYIAALKSNTYSLDISVFYSGGPGEPRFQCVFVETDVFHVYHLRLSIVSGRNGGTPFVEPMFLCVVCAVFGSYDPAALKLKF